MIKKIKDYFDEHSTNEPTPENEIDILENKVEFKLPNDYKNFLKETNGIEGSIGEENYLALWRIEELIRILESESKIIVGSDGGNVKYTLSKDENNYIYAEEDFIGDYYKVRGNSLNEFLESLYNEKE